MKQTLNHTPVLLKEAIDFLHVKPGQTYVDATFGGGGHTQVILDQGGQVIAIDQDEEAVTRGRKKFGSNSQLTLVHDNFLNLADILNSLKINTVAGILFDLGLSSFQIETEGRGFSFMRDEPLDMRMDPNLAVTAKDLVNALGKKELYVLFNKLAQEQRAWAIAHALVRARKLKPIETTGELARIIESVYGAKRGKLHPATKAFQALRIAVNDELNNLKDVLPQAVNRLNGKGRLVVISFHEGEDRIVKHFIKDHHQLTNLTKKPVTPSPAELKINIRSRSAKLRVAQKQ